MSLLLALALLGAGPNDPVPVAVLAHPVAKGDRLSTGDFTVEDRAPAAARGGLTAQGAAGMEAARNLPAGMVVRGTDVIPAQLVRRGEPVAIRIVSGPLVITASGRALSGGAQGDSVRVVTNTTARTLDAIVDGSGTVRVTAP